MTLQCKKAACRNLVKREDVDLSKYSWLTEKQRNEIGQRCPGHAQDALRNYVDAHDRAKSKNPFRK